MDYLKYITDFRNPFSCIKVGTDCSGIDAPIQALKLLNIDYTYEFASDIDQNCKKSIIINDNPKIFFDDITTRNHSLLPHLDIYIAGFPCQTFSTLGNRDGFNDIRGTIFFHCFETIKNTKPSVFILENVKGLLNHNKGKTFQIILNKLKELSSYNIYYDIYNTLDYGLPQHRERVYIIGIQQQQQKNSYVKPLPIPCQNILSILDNNVIDPYYFTLTPHKQDILNDLKIKKDENWFVNLNVSSYKRSGAKLNICPCLLAGEGGNCTYYSTLKSRKLTEYEYLKLQGFPPTFKIVCSRSKTYKQCGNTMSVNVLCFILKNAFLCL